MSNLFIKQRKLPPTLDLKIHEYTEKKIYKNLHFTGKKVNISPLGNNFSQGRRLESLPDADFFYAMEFLFPGLVCFSYFKSRQGMQLG